MQTIRDAVAAVRKHPIRELLEEKRQSESYLRFDEIPACMKTVVLGTEDGLFFEHHSFLLRSYYYAIRENLRKRRIVCGGSTITQQLAKNLYLSFERTYRRKLIEFFVAIYLECMLSKEEILELYLNVIYYGNEIYGLSHACKHYFNVEPADLSVNQAITLACLLPAPTWHDLRTSAGTTHFYQWRDRILPGLCYTKIIDRSDLSDYRNARWDRAFSGDSDASSLAERYQCFQKKTQMKEYWQKIKRKGRRFIWNLETTLLRNWTIHARKKNSFSNKIQLMFVDSPSANTKDLLELLDRYGVKATFYVNSILCDGGVSEIQKRGHTICEQEFHADDETVFCPSWVTEDVPRRIYREIIRDIKCHGKTKVVQQDIYRINNTVLERILLWGIRQK